MKILIAEDNESLRTLLEEYISGLGHEVKSAADGSELVKLALGGRPDLVITDLNMPGMAGDSMIAMMDMYPDLAGIPVIIISGSTPAELADMGIPEGIPILSKPFDFARISLELGLVARKYGY